MKKIKFLGIVAAAAIVGTMAFVACDSGTTTQLVPTPTPAANIQFTNLEDGVLELTRANSPVFVDFVGTLIGGTTGTALLGATGDDIPTVTVTGIPVGITTITGLTVDVFPGGAATGRVTFGFMTTNAAVNVLSTITVNVNGTPATFTLHTTAPAL